MSENPDFRESENPDFQIFRFPDFRIFENPDFRKSQNPDFPIFGASDVEFSGASDARHRMGPDPSEKHGDNTEGRMITGDAIKAAKKCPTAEYPDIAELNICSVIFSKWECRQSIGNGFGIGLDGLSARKVEYDYPLNQSLTQSLTRSHT